MNAIISFIIGPLLKIITGVLSNVVVEWGKTPQKTYKVSDSQAALKDSDISSKPNSSPLVSRWGGVFRD